MRTRNNNYGFRNSTGRSVQASNPSDGAKSKGYKKVGALATGKRAIPSDEIIAAVGEMRERGMSIRKIAKELRIGESKAQTALSWYLLKKERG